MGAEVPINLSRFTLQCQNRQSTSADWIIEAADHHNHSYVTSTR